MTSFHRTRRLVLLTGAALLGTLPAHGQDLFVQAAPDCGEAKDHFEIARQIGTPDAYQAHIDAFGACPYASFARILKGQVDRAGGEPMQAGESAGPAAPAPSQQVRQAPGAPGLDMTVPEPAAAATTGTEDAVQEAPSVASDPFSDTATGAEAGSTAAGSNEPTPLVGADPAPVAIPDPDIAAPAADPGALENPSDIAEPAAPSVAPPPTDEAKLLADTLVDRLNALQGSSSENGPRVRYDSAVLDNGDLFLTNLRLTKDDGQPSWSGFLAPSVVVLKPKIEADGTLTANSIFMTKTSIRATEDNGPNDQVATIASISILDPRFAAVGAPTAGESLGPIDFGGVDIRSIVGFDPAGELLTIAAIQLTTNGVNDGLPESATVSLKNLAFTHEQMARITESNAAEFAALGPDFFDFTFTSMMQRDTAKRDLKLTQILEIGTEASLTFSAALGNFAPADIRTLIDAKNPAALIGIQASFEEAELNVVNTAMVDKVLAIVAKQQNIDAPLFRAAIPSAARDGIMNAIGNETLADTVATALRAFLDDPRTIRLSVKPSAPLPIVTTALQIAGSGDPIGAMALLSPSVAVNGGPALPLIQATTEPSEALPPADAAPSLDAPQPPLADAPANLPGDPSSDQAVAVPIDPLALVPPGGAASDPLPVPNPFQAEKPGSATASALADCDRLAADSDDPTKPDDIAGVKTPEGIDVKTAVPACEAAHRLAPNDARISFQLGRAYQAAGRDDEAARLYGEAADAGQAVAQYELALAYYYGRGVEASPEKAVELLLTSAAAGNGFAKYFVGIEKVNGTYIPQDYPAAYQLFEEAAASGVPEALVELGKMEYGGQGVSEDFQKAYDFYSQAAEKEIPGGYFYVGFMDAFGVGAPDATPLDAAQNMMKGLAAGYTDAEDLLVTNAGKIFEARTRQAIQDYLRSEGFYRGRSDGVFGPGTLQAIDAWRQAQESG